MRSLFYYFKALATREKELHEIQGILAHPKLRYIEVHAVRRLSFYEALASIYRTTDPLITYMHNRGAQKDPNAQRLLKQLATIGYIYTTHVMMDVLPIVSKLCLVFKEEDPDVTMKIHQLQLRRLVFSLTLNLLMELVRGYQKKYLTKWIGMGYHSKFGSDGASVMTGLGKGVT